MLCPAKTSGSGGRRRLPRACVWLDPNDRWGFSGETEGNAGSVSESQGQEARGLFRELPGSMEVGQEALSYRGPELWNKETARVQTEEAARTEVVTAVVGALSVDRWQGV